MVIYVQWKIALKHMMEVQWQWQCVGSGGDEDEGGGNGGGGGGGGNGNDGTQDNEICSVTVVTMFIVASNANR